MAFNSRLKGLPKGVPVTPMSTGRSCQGVQSSENFVSDMTRLSKSSSCAWAVDESSCDTSIALQCVSMESPPLLDFCISSKCLKRKRPADDAACRTDLSSLSLEHDPRLILGLGVTSSPSDSAISTGSPTSSGSLVMKETEEVSPTESGLGISSQNVHGLLSGCVSSVTSGCGSALASINSDIGTFPNNDQNSGVKADVLLGLGRLHCSSVGEKDDFGTKEGYGSASCISSGMDPGMRPQLGLTANLGTFTESNRASGLPFGSLQDGRLDDVCCQHIPVVDEGSTSARSIKSGGYIPSLLMGRVLDNVACANVQTLDGRLWAINGELGMNCSSNDKALEADLPVSGAITETMLTSPASGEVGDRPHKVCKSKDCGKGARGASGLCIAHGGGRRCQKQGCNKGAEGRTVYCKAHGGGPRCQSLGCTKSAEGKTDYCISHGGGRRCSQDGCSKAARGRSGLCIRHGGGKRCQQEHCTKSAEGYSGLCISHGGGRRCQSPGCRKGAQGSTMFCKTHGGGKRCMIQGCTKGAEGRTPLCKGHGGGKRCLFDGGGVCTKSVHGGTSFCVKHGGGKRCAVEECTKSARGKTRFCVRHGGGKRCAVVDCTKSAQGSTDFCKAHGGGKRCIWGQDCCPYIADVFKNKTGDPLSGPCEKFARGKLGLCAAHTALVQDQRVHGAGTLGNALPPGIGPGLFRGLVSRSMHQVQTMQCSSDASKQSTSGGEDDFTDHSSDCGGLDSRMQACTSHRSSRLGPAVGREEGTCRLQNLSHVVLGRHRNAGTLRPAGYNLGMPKLEEGHLNERNARASSAISERSGNHVFPTVGPAQITQNYVAAAKLYIPYFLNVRPPGRFGLGGRSAVAGPLSHRPFIPPKVLVPLSMQKGEALPAQEKGDYCRKSDDGIFNMSLLSLPDERVHGGNIMTLLSEEASEGSTRSQSDVRSSQDMFPGHQKENEKGREEGCKLDRVALDLSRSLGDVGRFLATGVDED